MHFDKSRNTRPLSSGEWNKDVKIRFYLTIVPDFLNFVHINNFNDMAS